MTPERENPYEPPSAPAAAGDDPGATRFYPDASAGKRLSNVLIDSGLITVCGFVIAWVTGERSAGDELMRWLRSDSTSREWALGIAMLAYYLVFEAVCGRTLGKLITGTKVVDEAGGKARFLAILWRTLVRFVPFEWFSFLRNYRGWHDRWSGTRVVDIRDNPGWEPLAHRRGNLLRRGRNGRQD